MPRPRQLHRTPGTEAHLLGQDDGGVVRAGIPLKCPNPRCGQTESFIILPGQFFQCERCRAKSGRGGQFKHEDFYAKQVVTQ